MTPYACLVERAGVQQNSKSPAAFGSETLTSYVSFHGVCRSKSCAFIMSPSAAINDFNSCTKYFRHGVIVVESLILYGHGGNQNALLQRFHLIVLFLGDFFVLGTCHPTSGRTPCSRTCWAMAHQTPTCMWQGFLPVPVKR